MAGSVAIAEYVNAWDSPPFAHLALDPWHVVAIMERVLAEVMATRDAAYHARDGFAVHHSATIEAGAVLKGRGVVGPRCLVAAGAYLRGGVYLGADCTVGPGSEIKSSVLFPGSALAHFNFVGDSIIGSDVNLEAGAVIANHRNERADKTIRIAHGNGVIETGVEKFGALIGDGSRIGANAVIAPGALLPRGTIVPRLQLIDQAPR